MELFFPVLAIVILVFSAILHEIAHGYVAERFGDPTARLAGRLTLNPKSHIDPLMSILLPLILILSQSSIIFGAAKPVPVDPFNLKDGLKDIAIVALAGPATNLIIAVLGSVLFHALVAISAGAASGSLTFLILITFYIVQINLVLAIFNLLPIPPLDGSKVFAMILPKDMADAYLSLSSFGFFILLILLFFPLGGFSLIGLMGNLVSFSLQLLGLL